MIIKRLWDPKGEIHMFSIQILGTLGGKPNVARGCEVDLLMTMHFFSQLCLE